MALRFVCPDCRRAELPESAATIFCPECGVRFPSLNGVPMLLPKKMVLDLRPVLMDHLNLHHATTSELNEVFLSSAAYIFLRRGLEQEFGNLRGRFAMLSEAALLRPEGQNPEQNLAPLWACTSILDRHFLAGEATSRSLRVRNITDETTFATLGETPHHLSYHLYDERGELTVFDGLRSPFPIPLKPGDEITIPMSIEAPPNPGKYRLDVALVHELVRWYDSEPILREPITVGQISRRPWIAGLSGDFDYETDLKLSVEVLHDALNRLNSPKLLELACGFYPVSARINSVPSEHFAMDLCYPELQLAAIHHRIGNETARNIRFFCGDVDALPFAPHSLDCAVICAALHHFPNPVSTLRLVREVLAESGLLVVLREPCHVNPYDRDYLEQLRLGFNEQQFRPEEYDAMFCAAGFDRVAGRIDFGGSLKAILKPCQGFPVNI